MRRTLATLLVAPLVLAAASTAVSTETPRIQVVPHAVAPRVDILIDGKPFTSYIYRAHAEEAVAVSAPHRQAARS